MILVVAWLIYCRYTQTRAPLPPVPERYPSDDELFLRDHQRLFDHCQQRKPIYIVDNSRQARFWRWLKREKICPPQGQEVFELQEMNEALRERHGISTISKTTSSLFPVARGSQTAVLGPLSIPGFASTGLFLTRLLYTDLKGSTLQGAQAVHHREPIVKASIWSLLHSEMSFSHSDHDCQSGPIPHEPHTRLSNGLC